MAATKPKISVIVCTYNRTDLLPGCLLALSEQTLSTELFEVVIVDNNSTDNTQEIVNRVVSSNTNFRIITESKQGLSHARNRGWQEAVGEFIAYIDDDAKAEPDWLMQMYSFIKCNSTVEAFGGPYRAFYLKPPPFWFPPEYGNWSLGEVGRKIETGKEFLSGSNIVFHKDLLASFGGFRTSLGMKGQQISYGEETRLLLDIAESQKPVYYVPEMRVSHLVAPYKMNLRWLLFSAYANGRCSNETLKLRRALTSHIRGLAIGLAKIITNMIAPAKGPLKRRLYYALKGLCWEMGAMVESLSSDDSNPG